MKMKKRIVRIILILIAFLVSYQICSVAANIVSTDKQVETGSGNVTIFVTSRQSLGAYTLKLIDTAGLTLVSASGGEVSSDNKTITGASATGTTSLGSFTFKVPNVTEDKKYNIKFSITGMETPNFETIANETNTAVLTVKAKAQTTTTTQQTNTATEPKFTEVNKTMYATGEINLRSSWSTSSQATKVAKGTELKVTGTSSNQVNGYTWYRVSYNGTTKYVASSLLTSTKPTEGAKSSNANLKSLIIQDQELIPEFDVETLKYTIEVEEDITDLEIKAEAEDAKATISIQGEKDLKEGENTVTISVSAEDGTVKVYEIKVTKGDQTVVPLGLKFLKIENTDIDTIFAPEVYEYEIEIDDVDELEIEAEPNYETASVEIKGNSNLREGNNQITIIVTSNDGQEKVTYQIKANKVLATSASVTENKQEIDPKMYFYVGIGGFILLVIIITIICIIKHRNKDEYEEDQYYDYTSRFENFSGEKEYENEQEETEEIVEPTSRINNQIVSDTIEDRKIKDRSDKIDLLFNIEDGTPKRSRGKHF